MRERFFTNGLEDFLNYEVVELFLKFTDPRADHKPTATAMMGKFGSLGGIQVPDKQSYGQWGRHTGLMSGYRIGRSEAVAET